MARIKKLRGEKKMNYDIPVLLLKDNRGYRRYPQIGYGSEGSVHKYDDIYAFKEFTFFEDKDKLPGKFKKIELLTHKHIEGCTLPIGFTSNSLFPNFFFSILISLPLKCDNILYKEYFYEGKNKKYFKTR